VTLIAVASASGSPGVTTLAALIGAARADCPLVVEASPFGGTLASLLDLHWNPGIASLAAASRDEISTALLAEHAQTSRTGLSILAGPASSIEMAPALARVVPLLERALARSRWNLIIDCGTVWPGSPTWPLAIAADLTILVLRQYPEDPRHTAARISHTHALASALNQAGAGITIAVIGSRPYPAKDVAAAVGAAVVGVIPNDAAAVRAAFRPSHGRGRSKLAEGIDRLSGQLTKLLESERALVTPLSDERSSPVPEPRASEPVAPGSRSGRRP
jgi:MinD-like ATPase involved in chromosome partitioning or flagellar assembly